MGKPDFIDGLAGKIYPMTKVEYQDAVKEFAKLMVKYWKNVLKDPALFRP